MDAFNLVLDELKELKRKNRKNIDYAVPALWLGNNEGNTEIVKPYDFFIERFEEIISSETVSHFPNPEKWSDDAVIYNLFVRYATAFDHNQDGEVTSEPDEFGFKETGTFLKAIAILPYLRTLGVNSIYLLPITSIGIDGKKGNLGSPYAIRNPYKLDENLAENFIEADVEMQFKAFTEAAHKLGMKVVCEFIFRTASIDSDLALDNPDWFYWIKENIKDRKEKNNEKQYGPPIFNKAELKKIKEKVEILDLKNLPEPHELFKNMFAKTPQKVARVEDKIVGVFKDPDGKIRQKNNVRVPGAFADWPPDDNQPVWSDVTYLKLYSHPDYNYIAYNTVRMYEEKLAKEENKLPALWENIENIIPHYQKEFDIDGVMIDMGHALPEELRANIISKAREEEPNFVFWEENFSLSEESKKNGYNASLGYMPFDAHNPWKMRDIIKMFEEKRCPLTFFGTAETHNTKRAASREGESRFSKMTYAANAILPAMTFIHNGFEFCETTPVNTGLGFKDEEIEKYPSDKLPLFSIAKINWSSKDNIIDYIKQVNEFAGKYIKESNDLEKVKIYLLEGNHYDIVSFIRRIDATKTEILFAGNYNEEETIEAEIDLLNGTESFTDILTGNTYKSNDGKLNITLAPFEFVLGILDM
jgi:starch synthase (maltosyl-transferring)